MELPLEIRPFFSENQESITLLIDSPFWYSFSDVDYEVFRLKDTIYEFSKKNLRI